MKNRILAFLTLLVITLGACSKKKPLIHDQQNEGYLQLILKAELTIVEKNTTQPSPANTDAFQVSIFNSQGVKIREYARSADIPALISLPEGIYQIEACSGPLAVAAFESPYYYGAREVVIEPSAEVQAEVVCKQLNCAVSITYTNNVKQNYTDYYTEITVKESTLLFDKNENRKAYCTLAHITIKSVLSYTNALSENVTKMLTGAIPLPGAGKHYEIVIDARQVNGSAAIEISVDVAETAEIVVVDEAVIKPILTKGDILITEVMYNPDSIDDSRGEWFEVFNLATKAINLKDIIIERASGSHRIAADIILQPGGYYVLARHNDAFNGEKYVYGSSITLPNSPSLLTLKTYGTNGTDGEELFALAYGGAGFTTDEGVALNLCLSSYSIAMATLSSSWCASTNSYHTGDKGTPGQPNRSCD